ncbi:MAG: hypothetical protein WCA79_09015 [Anaerolineales bacterium]
MKSDSLEGKVALVRGAAKGIGKACALALADAAANIIFGLRDVSTINGATLMVDGGWTIL